MPLILSEADVRQVLPMPALIDAMETALVRFSTGSVTQPVRTVLQVGAQRAFYGVMPAYLSDPAAMGAKLVTVFPSNRDRGLPTHLALVALLDPETGALLALLDGRYITEARTAAVSAVSARRLADLSRPQVVAMLGSGVQAESHLEALAAICEIGELRVWSPTRVQRDDFAARARSERAAPAVAVDDPRTAVTGASLIVLVTASPTPVVHGDWVADGAHVIAVGACRPDQREMDSALVARGQLYVDSRAGALQEAGDILLPIGEGCIDASHIRGEIGEVIAGRAPGRGAAEAVTIFKSLGMAVEDVAAAHLAYRRAQDLSLGQAFTI